MVLVQIVSLVSGREISPGARVHTAWIRMDLPILAERGPTTRENRRDGYDICDPDEDKTESDSCSHMLKTDSGHDGKSVSYDEEITSRKDAVFIAYVSRV